MNTALPTYASADGISDRAFTALMEQLQLNPYTGTGYVDRYNWSVYLYAAGTLRVSPTGLVAFMGERRRRNRRAILVQTDDGGEINALSAIETTRAFTEKHGQAERRRRPHLSE